MATEQLPKPFCPHCGTHDGCPYPDPSAHRPRRRSLWARLLKRR
jgi:hypothetical protein